MLFKFCSSWLLQYPRTQQCITLFLDLKPGTEGQMHIQKIDQQSGATGKAANKNRGISHEASNP
jgi:hypothetical protein